MGRVQGWRWWHGALYAGAGFWTVSGLAWLASGAIAGEVTGIVALAAGTGLTVITWKAGARHRRSGCDGPRGLLLELARERAAADGVWLNRGEHLAFTVTATGRGPLRRWLVSRADEDQAHEFHAMEDGGRIALTADVFTMLTTGPQVLREPVGVVARVSADGEPVIEKEGKARAGSLRRIRLRLQALRAGHLYASAEELRELIGQFREAELVTPDSR